MIVQISQKFLFCATTLSKYSQFSGFIMSSLCFTPLSYLRKDSKVSPSGLQAVPTYFIKFGLDLLNSHSYKYVLFHLILLHGPPYLIQHSFFVLSLPPTITIFSCLGYQMVAVPFCTLHFTPLLCNFKRNGNCVPHYI